MIAVVSKKSTFRGSSCQKAGNVRRILRASPLHCLHRNRGMRVGCACPHLRSNPNRFHDLFIAGAFLNGKLRVTVDAVGALGSHGQRPRRSIAWSWPARPRRRKTCLLKALKATMASPESSLRRWAVCCRRSGTLFLLPISSEWPVYVVSLPAKTEAGSLYTSRCTIYSSADGHGRQGVQFLEVEECSIGPPNRLSAATKGQLETRRFRVPAHVAGAGRADDGCTSFAPFCPLLRERQQFRKGNTSSKSLWRLFIPGRAYGPNLLNTVSRLSARLRTRYRLSAIPKTE